MIIQSSKNATLFCCPSDIEFQDVFFIVMEGEVVEIIHDFDLAIQTFKLLGEN